MSFFFRKSTWGSAPDAKKAKTLNQAATALGVNEFMDQLRAALPAECMNTTKLDYDDASPEHRARILLAAVTDLVSQHAALSLVHQATIRKANNTVAQPANQRNEAVPAASITGKRTSTQQRVSFEVEKQSSTSPSCVGCGVEPSLFRKSTHCGSCRAFVCKPCSMRICTSCISQWTHPAASSSPPVVSSSVPTTSAPVAIPPIMVNGPPVADPAFVPGVPVTLLSMMQFQNGSRPSSPASAPSIAPQGPTISVVSGPPAGMLGTSVSGPIIKCISGPPVSVMNATVPKGPVVPMCGPPASVKVPTVAPAPQKETPSAPALPFLADIVARSTRSQCKAREQSESNKVSESNKQSESIKQSESNKQFESNKVSETTMQPGKAPFLAEIAAARLKRDQSVQPSQSRQSESSDSAARPALPFLAAISNRPALKSTTVDNTVVETSKTPVRAPAKTQTATPKTPQDVDLFANLKVTLSARRRSMMCSTSPRRSRHSHQNQNQTAGNLLKTKFGQSNINCDEDTADEQENAKPMLKNSRSSGALPTMKQIEGKQSSNYNKESTSTSETLVLKPKMDLQLKSQIHKWKKEATAPVRTPEVPKVAAGGKSVDPLADLIGRTSQTAQARACEERETKRRKGMSVISPERASEEWLD